MLRHFFFSSLKVTVDVILIYLILVIVLDFYRKLDIDSIFISIKSKVVQYIKMEIINTSFLT